MTMAFAVDEINNNSSLLPNVTLGYSLYDNCATLSIGFSAALSMASGQEEQFVIQRNCSGTPPVVGIVGDPFSTFSIAASNVLGLYKLPMVSLYFKIAFYSQSVARKKGGLTEYVKCYLFYFIIGKLFCHMFLSE